MSGRRKTGSWRDLLWGNRQKKQTSSPKIADANVPLTQEFTSDVSIIEAVASTQDLSEASEPEAFPMLSEPARSPANSDSDTSDVELMLNERRSDRQRSSSHRGKSKSDRPLLPLMSNVESFTDDEELDRNMGNVVETSRYGFSPNKVQMRIDERRLDSPRGFEIIENAGSPKVLVTKSFKFPDLTSQYNVPRSLSLPTTPIPSMTPKGLEYDYKLVEDVKDPKFRVTKHYQLPTQRQLERSVSMTYDPACQNQADQHRPPDSPSYTQRAFLQIGNSNLPRPASPLVFGSDRDGAIGPMKIGDTLQFTFGVQDNRPNPSHGIENATNDIEMQAISDPAQRHLHQAESPSDPPLFSQHFSMHFQGSSPLAQPKPHQEPMDVDSTTDKVIERMEEDEWVWSNAPPVHKLMNTSDETDEQDYAMFSDPMDDSKPDVMIEQFSSVFYPVNEPQHGEFEDVSDSRSDTLSESAIHQFVIEERGFLELEDERSVVESDHKIFTRNQERLRKISEDESRRNSYEYDAWHTNFANWYNEPKYDAANDVIDTEMKDIEEETDTALGSRSHGEMAVSNDHMSNQSQTIPNEYSYILHTQARDKQNEISTKLGDSDHLADDGSMKSPGFMEHDRLSPEGIDPDDSRQMLFPIYENVLLFHHQTMENPLYADSYLSNAQEYIPACAGKDRDFDDSDDETRQLFVAVNSENDLWDIIETRNSVADANVMGGDDMWEEAFEEIKQDHDKTAVDHSSPQDRKRSYSGSPQSSGPRYKVCKVITPTDHGGVLEPQCEECIVPSQNNVVFGKSPEVQSDFEESNSCDNDTNDCPENMIDKNVNAEEPSTVIIITDMSCAVFIENSRRQNAPLDSYKCPESEMVKTLEKTEQTILIDESTVSTFLMIEDMSSFVHATCKERDKITQDYSVCDLLGSSNAVDDEIKQEKIISHTKQSFDHVVTLHIEITDISSAVFTLQYPVHKQLWKMKAKTLPALSHVRQRSLSSLSSVINRRSWNSESKVKRRGSTDSVELLGYKATQPRYPEISHAKTWVTSGKEGFSKVLFLQIVESTSSVYCQSSKQWAVTENLPQHVTDSTKPRNKPLHLLKPTKWKSSKGDVMNGKKGNMKHNQPSTDRSILCIEEFSSVLYIQISMTQHFDAMSIAEEKTVKDVLALVKKKPETGNSDSNEESKSSRVYVMPEVEEEVVKQFIPLVQAQPAESSSDSNEEDYEFQSSEGETEIAAVVGITPRQDDIMDQDRPELTIEFMSCTVYVPGTEPNAERKLPPALDYSSTEETEAYFLEIQDTYTVVWFSQPEETKDESILAAFPIPEDKDGESLNKIGDTDSSSESSSSSDSSDTTDTTRKVSDQEELEVTWLKKPYVDMFDLEIEDCYCTFFILGRQHERKAPPTVSTFEAEEVLEEIFMKTPVQRRSSSSSSSSSSDHDDYSDQVTLEAQEEGAFPDLQYDYGLCMEDTSASVFLVPSVSDEIAKIADPHIIVEKEEEIFLKQEPRSRSSSSSSTSSSFSQRSSGSSQELNKQVLIVGDKPVEEEGASRVICLEESSTQVYILQSDQEIVSDKPKTRAPQVSTEDLLNLRIEDSSCIFSSHYSLHEKDDVMDETRDMQLEDVSCTVYIREPENMMISRVEPMKDLYLEDMSSRVYVMPEVEEEVVKQFIPLVQAQPAESSSDSNEEDYEFQSSEGETEIAAVVGITPRQDDIMDQDQDRPELTIEFMSCTVYVPGTEPNAERKLPPAVDYSSTEETEAYFLEIQDTYTMVWFSQPEETKDESIWAAFPVPEDKDTDSSSESSSSSDSSDTTGKVSDQEELEVTWLRKPHVDMCDIEIEDCYCTFFILGKLHERKAPPTVSTFEAEEVLEKIFMKTRVQRRSSSSSSSSSSDHDDYNDQVTVEAQEEGAFPDLQHDYGLCMEDTSSSVFLVPSVSDKIAKIAGPLIIVEKEEEIFLKQEPRSRSSSSSSTSSSSSQRSSGSSQELNEQVLIVGDKPVEEEGASSVICLEESSAQVCILQREADMTSNSKKMVESFECNTHNGSMNNDIYEDVVCPILLPRSIPYPTSVNICEEESKAVSTMPEIQSQYDISFEPVEEYAILPVVIDKTPSINDVDMLSKSEFPNGSQPPEFSSDSGSSSSHSMETRNVPADIGVTDIEDPDMNPYTPRIDFNEEIDIPTENVSAARAETGPPTNILSPISTRYTMYIHLPVPRDHFKHPIREHVHFNYYICETLPNADSEPTSKDPHARRLGISREDDDTDAQLLDLEARIADMQRAMQRLIHSRQEMRRRTFTGISAALMQQHGPKGSVPSHTDSSSSASSTNSSSSDE